MGLNISGGIGSLNSMPAQDFAKGLKDQSTESLVKLLGNDKLSPEAKEMVGKELEERMNAKEAKEAKGADSAGGEDEDDLKKLLKKLQDGTITAEELKKLGSMLGVDPEKLEGMKGKGGAQEPGDIQ